MPFIKEIDVNERAMAIGFFKLDIEKITGIKNIRNIGCRVARKGGREHGIVFEKALGFGFKPMVRVIR